MFSYNTKLQNADFNFVVFYQPSSNHFKRYIYIYKLVSIFQLRHTSPTCSVFNHVLFLQLIKHVSKTA